MNLEYEPKGCIWRNNPNAAWRDKNTGGLIGKLRDGINIINNNSNSVGGIYIVFKYVSVTHLILTSKLQTADLLSFSC